MSPPNFIIPFAFWMSEALTAAFMSASWNPCLVHWPAMGAAVAASLASLLEDTSLARSAADLG